MKVDVKWLDGQWTAFMPTTTLVSAGIMDIVDQVNEAWPELEKGRVIEWTATGNKFVVREVDAAQKKLSKSSVTELIERSSLGTPEAKAIRSMTPPDVRDEILRRVTDE